MLAELAAASAAYSTIKKAITQGRELVDVGKQIADFATAEDDLRAKADAKKKSIFNQLLGKDTSEFEEFLALDRIRQQKDELRSMMQLYGRPGMYDAWIAFQAKGRKARQQAKKLQEKRKQELIEFALLLFIGLSVLCLSAGGLYLWIIQNGYY